MAKRKPKAMARTFVQIKDETWHCYLWRSKDYDKVFGKDSGAITDPDAREMHFRDDEHFSTQFICHEIVHAHWTNLHLDSTKNMQIDDIEEIVASFVGKNIISLYQDTLHVYNELKKDLSLDGE